MKILKKVLFLILVLVIQLQNGMAQSVVINELDSDTPGIDDKEFVELKSPVPNYSLEGYVLVFFNGSANGANTAYLAFDLGGYKTDLNGILLIGSAALKPFPQYVIEPNLIQNGEDAVAIYKGSSLDFPMGTLAVANSNLVDVLIYGTNDGDAVGLIDIFKQFNPSIKQMNEGQGNNTNSIQRNNDGSYKIGIPTPRLLNDGSGILQNGVLISTVVDKYTEGEKITIEVTTERPVDDDLSFSLILKNNSFKEDDYDGITNLVISKGNTKTSTVITLVDDALDEGDEEMVIKISAVPELFLPLNNNIVIRIEDNDYKVANFGTPINSTYGKVKSSEPTEYYKSINGLSGMNLKNALKAIVSDVTTVKAQTYNDVINILEEADQNPENSSQVWLVYLEKGRSKLDFQSTITVKNPWNREHIWPRSRGGFNSIEADETIDGKNIFWPTNADSLRHANSDAHALRAADAAENSSRGNQFYGQYNGPVGTLGGFKGDVARSIFFLGIRYNGLEVVNGYPEGEVGKFGDLATLLEWHRNDPPDDFEMNRNNIVYSWQNNRNPFIDKPDLVAYVYGEKMNDIWLNNTNTNSTQQSKITLYPNPTNQVLQIKGISQNASIEVVNNEGKILAKHKLDGNGEIPFDYAKGIYFVKISEGGRSYGERVVVE